MTSTLTTGKELEIFQNEGRSVLNAGDIRTNVCFKCARYCDTRMNGCVKRWRHSTKKCVRCWRHPNELVFFFMLPETTSEDKRLEPLQWEEIEK